MAVNRGKQFEAKVKEDILKLDPELALERFPDQVSGWKGSKNPSDFTLYWYPYYYYIECKTTNENTLPLSAITQYDALLERHGKRGVRAGIVLWWVQHDTIAYVPVATLQKLKQDNMKSVNIKMLNNENYRIIQIPAIKKRVFMDADFSVLKQLQEGD